MKNEIDWKKQNRMWLEKYGELTAELHEQFHGIDMGMDGFSYPKIFMILNNFFVKMYKNKKTNSWKIEFAPNLGHDPKNPWERWNKNFFNAKRFFESKGNLATKSKLKDKWFKEF